MSRVTLKQVAEQAGVSIGVASTVLSGRKNSIGVSDAVRSRVVDVARALGYRSVRATAGAVERHADPAPAGRLPAPATLAGASRRWVPVERRPDEKPTIGVIWDYRHISDFWQATLMASLESALSGKGMVTQVANLSSSAGLADAAAVGRRVQSLKEALWSPQLRGADGVIILDLHGMIGWQEIEEAVRTPELRHQSVVVANGGLFSSVPCIVTDDRASGAEAARHLIDRGHDRFLFFAPFQHWAEWQRHRVEGARVALGLAGLRPTQMTVWPDRREQDPDEDEPSEETEESVARLRAAMKKTAERLVDEIRQSPSVPGVIAANDEAAFALLHAAESRGLSVPQDFAIVSFDDSISARQLGLTSMRPPLREIGMEAGAVLHRLLRGEQVNFRVQIPAELIVRASTAGVISSTRGPLSTEDWTSGHRTDLRESKEL